MFCAKQRQAVMFKKKSDHYIVLTNQISHFTLWIPSIYWIFRVSQNANRYRIINQMFAKSLPVDARDKKFRLRPLNSEVTSSGRRPNENDLPFSGATSQISAWSPSQSS